MICKEICPKLTVVSVNIASVISDVGYFPSNNIKHRLKLIYESVRAIENKCMNMTDSCDAYQLIKTITSTEIENDQKSLLFLPADLEENAKRIVGDEDDEGDE